MQDDKNEIKIPIKPGEHAIGVTFIANTYIPQPFLNRSYKRSILDDNPIEGYWQSPQISQMVIQGPIGKATEPTETVSRRKILICTPKSAAEELPCAKSILDQLARRAYRRPITEEDSRTLLSFYDAGRKSGEFEDGIERGVQFILAHPEFVFRTNAVPANVKPGEAYRLSDLELAS